MTSDANSLSSASANTTGRMSTRTLAALRGSIAKWERIVWGGGIDHGTDNCPLCARFYYANCRGCPVSAATGKECCYDSPYMKWVTAFERATDTYCADAFVIDERTHNAAKAELAFLQSLLPGASNG